MDYVYNLLAVETFAGHLANENRARNLAIFTQLVSTYQTYHCQIVITARGREYLRFTFFNSLLRLLHEIGINEHEDPDQPLPKGHVQVMTIHQAKGLAFPVVMVGSLASQTGSLKEIDRMLGPYYHRPPFEPEDRITGCDRMRLHYVAFSRAKKVLVLTTREPPLPHFRPISQGLPKWPYVKQDVLTGLRFPARVREPPKRSYGFNSDLRVYETCPRQYQFFH